MKIWVDLANSPHPPFFAPLVRELEGLGHSFIFTAWDRAQTRALASARWPRCIVVGDDARSGLFAKSLRVWDRSSLLRDAVHALRPELALSHNSYSQIVAARRLGVTSITMMDYEHQPANHVAFRLADWIFVPYIFPDTDLRRQGGGTKVVKYAGLKEEITLVDFKPDPRFPGRLGLLTEEVAVVARPAPVGALYHRRHNDLFDAAVCSASRRGARVWLVPRTNADVNRYGTEPGVTVLEEPVPGDQLLFYADAFIGGGGTMTREAALLGTPTYSLFSGKPAAVDEFLIAQGRMRRIASVDDVTDVVIGKKPERIWSPNRRLVRDVSEQIDEIARRVRDRVSSSRS